MVGAMRRIAAAALMLGVSGTALAADPPADPLKGTMVTNGLLPVAVDRDGGRILVTLPPAGTDGVSARFLYVASLRTGIGSSQTGLDHGQNSETQLLAFRRLGKKIVAEFENPRFRATDAPAAEQTAARESFATTTAWVGDIAATRPDGTMVVDLAPFLLRDTMGVALSLRRGGGGEYRLDSGASVADPTATRVFPDNIELEARQTFVSERPGEAVDAIAPDARSIALTVHHSLIRLPAPGYVPIRFDPRFGGFGAQAVDYAAPLGQDVVYTLANRFRLEKADPAAPRSAVKKPITFYIDRAAPEPIRSALAEGVAWWRTAFDAAGFIDAFRVEILPEGADPLDIRYNVVNWVNRATRGWSYGQVISDPRTGEIVKGSVLLGSLRVRQDMLIYEALVGANLVGTGGPNDPVRVALARIRQLGAHEVGHALGLEHNFAASTQDRASVMDYPAPRILLKDGRPDLSDAYGTGVGRWDLASIARLYGDPAAAAAQADALKAAGLRFISDGDARAADTAHPDASLWDDGSDPVAELDRMMTVRRAALTQFGPAALRPGEAAENLRRKFVPIWLLHRYQVEAAAKVVGGVDFAYAVAGGGHEAAAPVTADRQRAALFSLLATLSPTALAVPPALLPLLSAGRSGPNDRQFDIEVMPTAGGPVFDPLVAAEVAAGVTLDTLLAPARLERLEVQHAAAGSLPGAQEVVGRTVDTVMAGAGTAAGQQVATRALIQLAALSRAPDTAPGVAAVADQALIDAADRLGKGRDAWSRATARLLRDPDRLAAAVAERGKRLTPIPPGMPIGESDWMD
ncbi:peptidase [Sphingomonas metalli]|uniref:Peptidase n=1 Tax=Sphingomonas metalli TaxID=1779358 RepID=A0A916T047_9SPHN|nr:zinc-dependent metalloprotease [Sphingomonas metalli]GGB25989.1 peptidase [Sphingomonas metalli]